MKVLRPPLDEQQAIVKWIEASTRGLLSTVERAEREINLLREYRTRLIADVVTGKLTVCGVELSELNEVDEVNQVEDEGPEDSEELEAVEESVNAD